jgi:hypothetical protein
LDKTNDEITEEIEAPGENRVPDSENILMPIVVGNVVANVAASQAPQVNASTAADRGKKKAATTTHGEKKSLRIQMKNKSKRSNASGTKCSALLDNFPYAEFTDSEIVKMFEISGFSLGKTEEIRMNVVNSFRMILRDKFCTILEPIIAANANIIINSDRDLVDISSEFLQGAQFRDSCDHS